MKTNRLTFTLIVCVVLFILQTSFLLIPVHTIHLYNMMLQPLVFVVLAVAVFVFIGHDARHIPGAYAANMVAILSILTYGIVILALSFLFGAGTNAMTADPTAVVHSLWTRALIVVSGEYIRYKLIKSADSHNRVAIICLLTIALAYVHMDSIRLFIHMEGVIAWAVFFEDIFRPLVVSAVASYIAVRGSLLSVILVAFVYLMAPYFLPVLPDITPIAFAIISTGLVFLTAIAYRFFINDRLSALRLQEKRMVKYEKKSVLSLALVGSFIILSISFFMGAFPIYPIIALTDSMSGTFERGSIVFVQRVPPGEAYVLVGEGYVIHFRGPGGVEYVHRVVDFRLDAAGQRQYITQGDASELVDPFRVAQGEVLGIARAVLPFFGHPYIFFRSITRTITG